MLRTNQMKSLSSKLAQKIDALLPKMTEASLIPIAHSASDDSGRLEYARFNRESPRRRRYRSSSIGSGPAAVKASWF